MIDRKADVVGIDEAHFFDNGIVDLVQNLANRGVLVIVSGLDMDFAGRPFGPMPTLLALADKVEKGTANCADCERHRETATRTQRFINGLPASWNDQLVRPVNSGGGIEHFPTCRTHHRITSPHILFNS